MILFTPLKQNPNAGGGVLDLRPFLQDMGTGLHQMPVVSERSVVPDPFELMESAPVEIEPRLVDNSVFIDGIQAAKILTYMEHRPVILSFTSAGGISQALHPVDLVETLEIVCSELDAGRIASYDCPVAVNAIADRGAPGETDLAVRGTVNDTRDKQEFLLAARLLKADPDGLVISDGHLAHRPEDRRMLGIVKTVNTQMLADETGLWALREGWRSPAFKVPARFGGGNADRYSSYVRLRSSAGRQWSHGLIRVETFDPDMLDVAAGIALGNRQHVNTDDPRGDRHVVPVARVEKWLKSRIPYYLAGG